MKCVQIFHFGIFDETLLNFLPEDFLYHIVNCFTAGTLTFCSQNIGAGKIDRIKKEVWISILCIVFTGLFIGGIFTVFGRQLLRIYTSNPQVIEEGMRHVRVTYLLIFICGMMHGFANSIRGIGHSLMPVISITIGCCIFRVFWISVIFQLPQFHTPESIFVSYPLSWIITTTINFVFYLYYMKKLCIYDTSTIS